MAKLPNISVGGFERVRRGRGLGLFMAAVLAVWLAIYLWLGG